MAAVPDNGKTETRQFIHTHLKTYKRTDRTDNTDYIILLIGVPPIYRRVQPGGTQEQENC